MKLKSLALACAAAALVLTGCWQKSLHPFYKAKDVIFDEALLGNWTEVADDKPGKWGFTQGEATNVYRLQIQDEDTKLDLDARLFKIGDNRFLDFHSRSRPINEIPAHHLFRVREIGPSLKLQIMSMDWVAELIGICFSTLRGKGDLLSRWRSI